MNCSVPNCTRAVKALQLCSTHYQRKLFHEKAGDTEYRLDIETRWTDENVEKLKKLWKEGLSASAIAARFGTGCTRNSIIGKAHRLNLAGRPVIARPARIPRKRQPRAVAEQKPDRRRAVNTITIPGHALMSMVGKRTAPLKASPPVSIFDPSRQQCSIVALPNDGCKFPVNDVSPFRFCNQPRDLRVPYCNEHLRVAITPPRLP